MLAIDKNMLTEENEVSTLISNVLVPVDFSKRCARAASFALDLAHHFHAKVPVVEPEVLIKGDHTMRLSEEITQQVLRTVFHTLEDYRLDLSALVLKVNMVTPGIGGDRDCVIAHA